LLGSQKIVSFVAVTDYAKSRAFYEGTLGLKFVSQDDFAIVMEGNGTKIRMAKVPNLQPAHFTVLGWEVSAIEKMVEDLQSRGVEVRSLRFHAHGRSTHLDCARRQQSRVVQGSRRQRSFTQRARFVVSLALAAAQFADDVAHEAFGVAEEHEGFLKVVKRIVDTRETWAHAAFNDHHRARFIYV
jgi:catechol 2,3-dioxygenase-like lactoylglutathione lyase family enzyme